MLLCFYLPLWVDVVVVSGAVDWRKRGWGSVVTQEGSLRRFVARVCLALYFQRESFVALPRLNGGVLGMSVVAVETGCRGGVEGSS